MPLTAYVPLDPERFRRDNRSVAYSPLLPAGAYVYIQDCSGTVWILPDGTHRHPHVLGRARPAVAAGELITGENGEVLSINNLSGTFQCASDSLLTAVGGLVKQGAKISADAITIYEA
jgi:hypothetical protein